MVVFSMDKNLMQENDNDIEKIMKKIPTNLNNNRNKLIKAKEMLEGKTLTAEK